MLARFHEAGFVHSAQRSLISERLSCSGLI
jgi:hypothetical protein